MHRAGDARVQRRRDRHVLPVLLEPHRGHRKMSANVWRHARHLQERHVVWRRSFGEGDEHRLQVSY